MSLVVVNDLVWTRQLTAEDHSIPGGSKTDEPAKQCGNRANHVGGAVGDCPRHARGSHEEVFVAHCFG